MPILVYGGLGTSNLIAADRDQGYIMTGKKRFLSSYSIFPRTVPRVLRERKRMINVLDVDSPSVHQVPCVTLFFYIWEIGFAGRTHLAYKNPYLLSPIFFFININYWRLALFSFNCLIGLGLEFTPDHPPVPQSSGLPALPSWLKEGIFSKLGSEIFLAFCK